MLPGGGLRLSGVTLHDLVVFAWDMHDGDVTGGPAWVRSEAWDVVAKPEKTTDSDTAVAPGTTAWNRVRLRTQTLLEERFQLRIRKTSKQMNVYALVPAKGGTKLTQTKDTGNARTMRSFGRIDAQRGSMAMLAAVLTNMLGKPVVDRSELSGTYDYKLEYAQEGRFDGRDESAGDVPGPSIFTALQEQLGLKLEPTKAPVENIVIEAAEKASDN
jgi:uncharacterized protein (TIGR03435 family)